MGYPKHIPGTWQFSGDWLGSYRLIAEERCLGDPVAEYRDILCPICEYPEAIHMSRHQPNFPLMYYCPECGTIYQWYIARCPDCDGFVRKKNCEEGKVKCSMCGIDLDIDFVKDVNEDVDFHNQEEYDE